ncbi:hypothetical protein JB92DRAFT_1946593 [Gautieria morchelliformis]|nr:hypothetical protein JB92DRAFT_1946593 [Gautieria morchelliformis]
MLHFRNTFAAALSIMLAPSPANATSTKLAPLVPGITRNSACLFPFPIFLRGLRYHPNRCLLLQSLPKALGFLTRQPTPPDPINFGTSPPLHTLHSDASDKLLMNVVKMPSATMRTGFQLHLHTALLAHHTRSCSLSLQITTYVTIISLSATGLVSDH